MMPRLYDTTHVSCGLASRHKMPAMGGRGDAYARPRFWEMRATQASMLMLAARSRPIKLATRAGNTSNFSTANLALSISFS